MRRKEKIGTNIGVVTLSTYTSPKVTEIQNQEWIKYGDNNDYFQYLQDRYNGSPTNNAAINGISQMIIGDGLDSIEKLIKPDEYAQVKLLFDYETLEKLANDLKAMGNCATNVQNIKDVTNLTFTIEDYFIENNFYEANFYLNDSLIFKDKLFLTTQSVTEFSINNGAFVEPTISNNDYIFI